MTDVIELQVKSGEAGYQPEPGWYPVEVTRVERIGTRLGEALRIWVKSDKWPSEWGFVTSLRLSKKSKLGQLVTALGFELVPGTTFSLSQIIGKKCAVMIYRDSKGFSRPQSFWSLEGKPPF